MSHSDNRNVKYLWKLNQATLNYIILSREGRVMIGLPSFIYYHLRKDNLMWIFPSVFIPDKTIPARKLFDIKLYKVEKREKKGPLEYLCQTCVTTCGIFVYTAVLIISIINQNLKATIHTLLRALMEYFLCLFIPDRQRGISDFIKKEREMGEGGTIQSRKVFNYG